MASGGAAPGDALSAAPPRALALLCAALRARVTGDRRAWDGTPSERDLLEETSRLASAHRVQPLLRGVLGDVSADAAEDRATAMRALSAVHTLRTLMRALAEAGVPALAWKGPALAVQAWQDPAARLFTDLDVVVPPESREAARRVVLSLGWRPRHAMSEAQERAIFDGLAAWEFVGDAEPTLLELHWEFSARRYAGRLPVRAVLDRAVNVAMAGTLVPVPNTADTIALLAQHATKHGWSSLEDVAVFAALAHREPRALVAAHERAGPVGGARAVRLGAALMARALELPLPAELGTAIGADHAIPLLVAQVDARWRTGVTAWRPPLAWDLAWTERASDRVRLLTRATFDPTMQEWDAVQLPDAFVGLYPVLRPFRRVWTAVRGARE